MRTIKYFLIFTMFFAFVSISAQSVRPIKDTVGFAWSSVDMDRLVSYLKNKGQVQEYPSSGLVGGLSPHDDYLYAARVYYPLYKNITAKEIVIIGVTHGTVRKAIGDPQNVIIIDNFDIWKGPYQSVKISPLREKIRNKLDPNWYLASNDAHTQEHSIEALLPFLQFYNREIKITPIMITAMSFEQMDKITDVLSQIIAEYIDQKNLRLGSDIFFLISSDADHYGKDFNNIPYGEDEAAHKKATDNDKRIAKSFINCDINSGNIKKLTEELWTNKPTPVWCGKYSVPFGMLTISKVVKLVKDDDVVGKIFEYSDSVSEGVLPIKNTKMGLTAPASFQHWCGWLSAGFYIK